MLCAAGAVVSCWNGNGTWLRVCDDGWKGRRGRVVEGLEGRSLWFARWRDITLSQGLETQSAVLDQSCNRHHKSPSQKPPTKAYS